MNPIPQEIQDVVSAIMTAYADIKANKAANIITDEIPSFMKIMSELPQLKGDANYKGLIEALIAFEEQIIAKI
jgi:hypothetical protein